VTLMLCHFPGKVHRVCRWQDRHTGERRKFDKNVSFEAADQQIMLGICFAYYKVKLMICITG